MASPGVNRLRQISTLAPVNLYTKAAGRSIDCLGAEAYFNRANPAAASVTSPKYTGVS